MTKTAITVTHTIMMVMICIGSSAQAAGDATAGAEKASLCAGCHGENGISQTPMYPNLAGQKEDYLVKVTTEYKDGTRNDLTMKAVLETLTDADIQNLAAYYAGMSCQ
jgi:cytochrome c553